MDKALIRHRFAKASGSYPRQARMPRRLISLPARI